MTTEYLHIPPGGNLPKSPVAAPFAAVVILDASISQQWREALSQWLVENGCVYMMAWGVECEEFHDCVDRANIDAFSPDEIPDEKFVMTTWHDDEPLEEVLWFAQHSAYHETIVEEQLLILDIATSSREESIMEQFTASEDLHLREAREGGEI